MLESNFNDYYDWIFYTYPDDNLKYVRTETKEYLKPSDYTHIRNHMYSHDSRMRNIPRILDYLRIYILGTNEVNATAYRNALIIGDELFLIYRLEELFYLGGSNYVSGSKVTYFGSLESLCRHIKKYNTRIIFDEDREFTTQEKNSFLLAVREHFKAPILHLHGQTYQDILNVVSNPNLSELGIIQDLPPAEEIHTLINNYLSSLKDEQVDVVFDDEIKRDQKGFNNRSFKHRKYK